MNTESAPVCLITGGSSGIGLATAKQFAGQGFHVAICGRRPEPLDMARQAISQSNDQVECLPVVADLSDIDQAKSFGQQAIQHFGRIDVLINNAAVAPLAPFHQISPRDFEDTINTNLRSLFYLTQLIWKQMKQPPPANVPDNQSTAGAGQGTPFRQTIVNVSSLAAVDPFPGFSIYGASKSWLELLTHSLAAEGEEFGIRVCAVRPGAVETPLLRKLFPNFPAEQCVSPETIAQTLWSVVSDPENFPSGQIFEIKK